MIQFRFYLVSLAAVFLALGIGILTGVALSADSLLSAKQQEVVEGMQEKIERLNRVVQDLKTEKQAMLLELQTAEQFARQVYPLVAKTRLTGKKVLIVSGRDGLLPQIQATVEQAGGEAGSLVFESPSLCAAAYLLNCQPSEREKIEQHAFSRLARFFATGEGREEIGFLSKLGFWEWQVKNWLPSTIVFLPGKSFSSWEQSIFLRQMRAWGVRVVAVEGVESRGEAMALARKEAVTTVDHVNTVYGQVALLLVLEGFEGHFGIKPGAEQLIPAGENSPI